MKFSRQKPEEVSVNLTPLIDVVFLLLIFFMVSTTFKLQTQLEIDLPAATGVPSETVPDALEIVVTAQGVYSVNGTRTLSDDAESLRQALKQLSGGDSSKPLTIAADAQTPHQAVVTAMDVARKLGFTKLSITTQESRN